MKIVKKYPDGIFSWVDLTTTDIAGAHVFYSGLFGWEPDPTPLPDDGGSYTNFRIDGYSVAGGGQMPPDMAASGMPSFWTSYVNHHDVDAVAARVAEAGGTVLFPPMDIMDQGRMGMFVDPQGATFGVWQPAAHIGAQVVNQPNSLVWNELQARDPKAAIAFYNSVFGWAVREDPHYTMWQDDNERVHCGLMRIDESWGDVPPNWLAYFLVEDVDAAAARAIELGGVAHHGPTDFGDMGRLAVLGDPQGAVFAVINFNGPVDEPPGTD